jgi:Fe-S cluster assembly ATP-binding protein
MANKAELVIEDLHVTIGDKEILKGLTLTVPVGERHVLMGPNGSGKSTLAYALMGHPSYEITSGRVTFGGEDLLDMEPDERAKAGLFLAFQYPKEIPGVTVSNFLRQAVNAVRGEDISLREFGQLLSGNMKRLSMDPAFARRYLNEGFSGGERKRNEMLQLLTLKPQLAILDETDSGLDVAMRQLVADVVLELDEQQHTGFLVVTHYEDVVRQMKPHKVHMMADGRVLMTGGMELVNQLHEEKSWDWLTKEGQNGSAH